MKSSGKMHFLMTTDVESFSIPLNREDSDVAKQIYEVVLPDSVGLVKAHGHDIGERLPLINEFAAIIVCKGRK